MSEKHPRWSETIAARHERENARDRGRFSDLKVMKSGAGYYIGTEYTTDYGNVDPGSRESVQYWTTRETAQHALDMDAWDQRENA